MSATRKVGAATVALAAAGSAIVMGNQVAAADSATATTGVNIRSGPGTSHKIIGGLNQGQKISAIGSPTHGWVKVSFNGGTGYVASTYLDTSGKTSASTKTASSSTAHTKGTKVATTALHVRNGPGLGHKNIGYIADGQNVSLTGKQSHGFAEVLYGGKRAWVSSQYLVNSTSSLPKNTSARVTTADLMIRTTPNANFKITTTAKKGTKLQATGATKNGYAQIVYHHTIRWVAAKHLTNKNATGPSSATASQHRASGKTSQQHRSGQQHAAKTSHQKSSAKSSAASTAKVVGSRYATTQLLLRGAPESGHQTAGTIPRGSHVKVTSHHKNGKIQVVRHGKAAWVTAEYLSSSKPRTSASSTSSAKHHAASGQSSGNHTSKSSAKHSSKPATTKDSSKPAASKHASTSKTGTHQTKSPSKHKVTSTPSKGASSKQSHKATKTSGKSVWDNVAQCESSGDWGISTGNGFHGGLQFTPQTWNGFGGSGKPQNASRAQQIDVAKRVKAKQGWKAWPACSNKLGLR